jgi:hypothetical protein
LNRLGDLRNDLASFLPPDHQPVKLPGLSGCTAAPA